MFNFGEESNGTRAGSSHDYFQMALLKKFENVRPSESFTDTDNEDFDSHSSGIWDEECEN